MSGRIKSDQTTGGDVDHLGLDHAHADHAHAHLHRPAPACHSSFVRARSTVNPWDTCVVLDDDQMMIYI
jgi:hypothetical protein